MRVVAGMSVNSKPDEELETGDYILLTRDPDLQAMVWALYGLQQNAEASPQILFRYGELINKVLKAT